MEDQADQVWIECSCGYDGPMRIVMVAQGCYASVKGPPEHPVFEVTCPKCSKQQEEPIK